jgi:hypothetical protein
LTRPVRGGAVLSTSTLATTAESSTVQTSPPVGVQDGLVIVPAVSGTAVTPPAAPLPTSSVRCAPMWATAASRLPSTVDAADSTS